MKLVGALLLCLCAVASADDFYFWNYLSHPYQTYYLEDYCGPVDSTKCDSEAHIIYLNSTGSGSAAVIRGFRASKPAIKVSVKCCITVKTIDKGRFNVQLDEIYLKQRRLGEKCQNFLRFHGLTEELGHVCSEIEKYSFRTPKNVMEVEYVLNSENVPDFQKVKVVVTSATDVTKMEGSRCSKEQEQWQCDDRSCIWEGFRCDAHNNCGDWSDELYCGFLSRQWPILLGIGCGIFVAILTWCVCRCCCCCGNKKTVTVKASQPFTFVSSFAPDRRPLTQEKLYPSLDVPYQNAATVPHIAVCPPMGPPPAYNENAMLTPAFNPSYGSTTKS